MHKFYAAFLFLSITLISSSMVGQTDHHQLVMKTRTVLLDSDEDSRLTQSDILTWPSYSGYRFGVVVLGQFPDMNEWNGMAGAGIEMLEYISGAYVVGIAESADLSLLNAFEVRASSAFLSNFKLLVDLNQVPSRARESRSKVLVNAHIFSNLDMEVVKKDLQGSGYKVEESKDNFHYVTFRMPSSRLEALTQHPAVQYIDWKYDQGYPENYTGRTLHRVNFISEDNTNGIAYSGEGINVMLQDDGFIGPHIDRHGRVVEQFWDEDNGDHGDHVSGTIMGAGNLNPLHEGQAKGANIFQYKAAPQYQGFDSIDLHYTTKDIVITSTSYSNGCNAGYTALARQMDEQVHTWENLMHVFSAGNSGTSNCGYGAGSFWGNVTGGHKVGKNVITVANLDAEDGLATSSSRGPAYDGRIKPDISAKGTAVTSTIAGNQYDTYNGTSMSCPGVSGTLAVLYEAFEDLQGDLPDAGLMKGIVLNTAEDIGNEGPDFKHGWGRINARKAYEVIASSTFMTASLSDGDSTSFTINVPSNTARVRFMVYWTDPEASISANTALINDLDMRVTDPSANVKLPWVLDPTPNATTLDQPAVNGEDHLNNMEQVEFLTPAAGNYEVKVKGTQIPMGPQEFHVIYWIEPEEFVLTYPIGGESLVPFTTEKIRWDSPFESGTVTAEYTTNGGSFWNTIASNVPIEQGYMDWNIPNLATGNVELRVNYSGGSVQSDLFSVIATPSGLSVLYSCPDSIGLTWNGAFGADGYTAHRLGNKYMEPMGTTTQTEFVDYNSNPMSEMLWYSVSSLGPDNAEGKRAVAVQKQPGIFNCTIDFDADLTSVNPSSGSFFDCRADSMEISFNVRNSGVGYINTFDATFQMGSQQLNESYTFLMTPGSDTTLTFSSKVAQPTSPEQGILSVDLSNDGNPFNDTLVAFYFPQSGPLVEPIWAEDFESFNQCSTENDCGITVCDLENGWVNEVSGVVDDMDWRTNSGSTPSNQTGPAFDHTTTNTSGNYLYLEASGDCNELSAMLVSPCIDLTASTDPTLSFWYNMYGADMGSLHVDVFDGESWVLDVMTAISGNQGTQWQLEEVSLSAFNGDIINIRFRGITGDDFRSDMAIDDIMIQQPPVANFTYGVQMDGVTIDLQDLSAYGDTMSFDLGDGTLLDSVPLTHTYAQIMQYTATQIVTNPVGSDTATQIINTLSTTEVGSELRVVLFPNPTREVLHVRSTDALGDVNVFSADGRLVRSFPAVQSSSGQFDIRSLPAGIYSLELSSAPTRLSFVIL